MSSFMIFSCSPWLEWRTPMVSSTVAGLGSASHAHGHTGCNSAAGYCRLLSATVLLQVLESKAELKETTAVLATTSDQLKLCKMELEGANAQLQVCVRVCMLRTALFTLSISSCQPYKLPREHCKACVHASVCLL